MIKNNGQSIIEYCVLAMLIIFGTIVMGPYVIRSINAHFKLWQESIDDSTNDRMSNVPINITPPECKCEGEAKGGCGASKRLGGQCAVNERYHYTPCSPPTCGFGTNFKEWCQEDSTCCNIYTPCSTSKPLGSCCGIAPIPDPTNPRKTTDPNELEPAPNNTNDYRRSCYYGEEILFNQCDANLIRCRPRTDGQCNAQCLEDPPSSASFCPGADQNLTEDTHITFLGGTTTCPEDPHAGLWHYACVDTAPFIGKVNLARFSPQSNYTLYLTPPQSHRLGLGIRLQIKIKDHTGKEAILPCRDSASGHCSGGLFEMPNSSNPSWTINSTDLSLLSPTGPYELSYEWIDYIPGDNRPEKISFGIAVALRALGAKAITPTSFTCPYSANSPSSIDAGSSISSCDCSHNNQSLGSLSSKTIEMYVDQVAKIYTSDAAGTQKNLIYSSPTADAASTLHNFTVNLDPTGTAYILTVITNPIGNGYSSGISLKDPSTGLCLNQINSSYPIEQAYTGWKNTGCWLKLPTGGSQVLFKITSASKDSCNTTCPNYTTDPSAPKCVAKCNPGTVAQVGYNNTVSCVCGNSEIAKSEEVVNAAAQASRTFASEVLSSPVNFKVEVHTEDLNFDIKFLDATGNILHRDVCTESEKNYRNNNGAILNDSCGGKDTDDSGAIDSYNTSFTANQVIVYVREGGGADSHSMGYSVYARGTDCHCGNGICDTSLGENSDNCTDCPSYYAIKESSESNRLDCSCTNLISNKKDVSYCNGNGSGYRVPSNGTRSGDIPPPTPLKTINTADLQSNMINTNKKWYHMTGCGEKSGWDSDSWDIYKIYCKNCSN